VASGGGLALALPTALTGLPLILGLLAFATLTTGGYIGGTLVFVYGVRVLKKEDVSVANALVPGRAEPPRD
jgi:hypothetical protein